MIIPTKKIVDKINGVNKQMEQLTSVEEMIMKCIWNYGKEMPFLELGKELKDK